MKAPTSGEIEPCHQELDPPNHRFSKGTAATEVVSANAKHAREKSIVLSLYSVDRL